MRPSSASTSPSVRSRSFTCEREEVLGDAARGLAQEAEDARRGGACGPRSGRPGSPAPGRPPTGGAPTSGSRASAITSASRVSAASARLVLGVAHPQEERVRRLAVEAAEEGERREEVELVGPPEEVRERREAVRLDRLDEAAVERARARSVGAKWPSRTWRPARPAIWPTSAGVSGRGPTPSNLVRPVKTTWSMSRFRPMPIASVATRWSTSPAW